MTWMDLTGKTALVTGAGRRVGACIAQALGEAGCDVIVHAHASSEEASRVAERVRAGGRRATVLCADLTVRNEIGQLGRNALIWSGGRMDILVHSAARFERVEPTQLGEEVWDRAMALNTTAPYLLTVALADALRASRGTSIAIACTSAWRPWRNYVPYATSKAALVHLVRGLALALAPEVRVNAVAPGAVLLPADAANEAHDMTASLCASIPLQRLGNPEDVARAVVFLAQNDYITGEVLTVDGGRSLR